MPTAVITESREKMASSTTICATTPRISRLCAGSGYRYLSFQPFVKLNGGFKSRNNPPNSIIRSRALKLRSCQVNQRFGQGDQPGDRGQQQQAHHHCQQQTGDARAVALRGGSFSARMAIKTRLSIPSTSSITTSVMSPAQIEGRQSIPYSVKTFTT
jgi:hypothetical protein